MRSLPWLITMVVIIPAVACAQSAGQPKLGDDRPLQIRNVRADRQSVEVFTPVEISADISGRYANPFDPDEIRVDAEITAPNGKSTVAPGFFFAPMQVETKQKAEHVAAAGLPDFRVRYTPIREGRYRIVLKVTDRSGATQFSPLDLTATKGQSPGFVRVAAASPHYFAFDSGRPYFAVGENVCWSWGPTPLADYGGWFRGLGAAGGNWARLWLAYNEKGLEWMPNPTPKPGAGTYLGLGKYALDNAWRLDEIVRQATASGIYLVFCLGTYGEFTEGGFFNEGCWISNPYNAKNGGPCNKPEEFWTNEKARKLYKNRLRYLIARWGYSPNVFAWEFWNEVPSTPAGDVWTAEMAAYLKQHDPNRHLVSTTYGSATTWKCPDIDFTMKHMYGQGGNTADFTPQIVNETREMLPFGKPYLLAEFGIDWQTGDNKWDPKGTGLNMHNGAWASMMSGAAGTSMLWYWDCYVAPFNLYRTLAPVRKFSDTIDWTAHPFRPLSGANVESRSEQPETFSDITVPGAMEWGRTPSNQYTALRSGVVEGGPIAMTLGSPKRGNPGELHTQITWRLDMPQAGKVVARLGQVCSMARLRISLDDKVVLDRELPAGEPGKGAWKSARRMEQWKVWVSDYDEDLVIDVPAGKHTLTFANTDGDWLQIRNLRLPSYRSSRYPDVNLLGLDSPGLLLLWLHNRESTWRTEYEGKQPRTLSGLQVSVPVSEDGVWSVEWWDTFKGTIFRQDRVQAASGKLRLDVPDVARDLAAKLKRE